jgi:hypothetical protein
MTSKISTNQKRLRALKRSGSPVWQQIVADVAPSTLRRHLGEDSGDKDKIPRQKWIGYYEEGLGWQFRDWFAPANATRIAKVAKKLREVAQEERMKS